MKQRESRKKQRCPAFESVLGGESVQLAYFRHAIENHYFSRDVRL
jgi:hypothetical protein